MRFKRLGTIETYSEMDGKKNTTRLASNDIIFLDISFPEETT